MRRDHGRKPRRQHLRCLHIGRRRNVVGIVQVERQRRTSHTQRVDRRGVRGSSHDPHGFFGERPQGSDLLAQRGRFLATRERATPQQMRSLLEAHATRQLVQLITADDELTRQPVDVTQTRLSSNDAIQAAGFYRAVDESSFASW